MIVLTRNYVEGGNAMNGKKSMNYKVEGIWKPFGKDNYKWAWHDKKVLGVLKCFGKELKYSYQRLRKGYCDYDLFSIYDWFLAVMPVMLQEYKDSRIGSPSELGENYPDEHGIMQNDTCHKEWDEILDRMIFLFQEADESTCKRLNPFDDEASRIYDEFDEKYGFFGEKLQTEQERAEREKTGNTTMHFPGELPEYKDAMERYFAAEEDLRKYREKCKDEAFALFSRWFYSLWD